MILFIRNILADTTNTELYDFVDPALKTGFIFRIRQGNIIKVEVICIRDKKNNHDMYHGLVYLDNYKAGLLAIKKLNGKRLGNSIIEVRKYAKRIPQNDKRSTQDLMASNSLERRKRNRRRDNQQIEIIKR